MTLLDLSVANGLNIFKLQTFSICASFMGFLVWGLVFLVALFIFHLFGFCYCPQLTDFQTKKEKFGSLDSRGLITVKLYTESSVGESIAFQLLLAQLCSLRTKEKAGYLEFISELAHNQIQLQNSTST